MSFSELTQTQGICGRAGKIYELLCRATTIMVEHRRDMTGDEVAELVLFLSQD